MTNLDIFRGRKILITGHTGFKGSWLSHVLLSHGAEVYGISLAPNTNPSLFELLHLNDKCSEHHILDIRNFNNLNEIVNRIKPEFVFHLAAQPLVRESYRETLYTHEVNILGTANLLESLKGLQNKCVAIIITSDKCYQNNNSVYGFREIDPLGGADPYSASKACAEILVASYRDSFYGINSNIKLASVRAGNVIGGGDWAQDRIIPDYVKAISSGKSLTIRNPNATRPWQHVLEPISGYLTLALCLDEDSNESLAGAFNFGPGTESVVSVESLIIKINKLWPGNYQIESNSAILKESIALNLVSDKARKYLDWMPKWDIDIALDNTIKWYKGYMEGESPLEMTSNQIKEYFGS